MDAKQQSMLLKTALAPVIFGVLLFVPAGSLAFWQAWVYCLMFDATAFLIVRYFLKKDPALLDRRSKMREQETSQQIIMVLFYCFYCGMHVFAGFDHRFQWSHVSAPLVILSDLVILLSFVAICFVLQENSYASSTITVEKGQQVITTGPYAIVRHPLYAGALPMIVSTPLALGSAWGLLFSAALIVLLVFRLLDEERYLLEHLPGYPEYTQKTRYRLIPCLW